MGKAAQLLVFFLFAFCCCCSSNNRVGLAMAQTAAPPAPVDVGVILDLQKRSLVGRMCNTSLAMAVEDFYAEHALYKTRLRLHPKDSNEDVVGAASAGHVKPRCGGSSRDPCHSPPTKPWRLEGNLLRLPAVVLVCLIFQVKHRNVTAKPFGRDTLPPRFVDLLMWRPTPTTETEIRLHLPWFCVLLRGFCSYPPRVTMRNQPARRLLFPSRSLVISCSLLLLLASTTLAEHGGVRGFNVGLVLDLGSLVGKMSLTSINMAVSDFYAAHPNSTTKLAVHTRDSGGDVVGAALAAVDLMKREQVQVIVGPQTSDEAMFLAYLGTKSRVPVISFSATSPTVSPVKNPYFLRAVPDDSAQARPIAALVQAFGWKRVVLVYEDTNYGAGPVPFLVDAFNEVDARVAYRCVIRPTATDDEILKQLYKLKNMQTRVFVVHMGWSLGSRLFSKANVAEMMSEGYVWIITDGLAGLLDSVDPSALIESMQGVIGVKPYMPRPGDLHDFKRRWKQQFIRDNPDNETSEPNSDALRAYDTVWALALVAEASTAVAPRFTLSETAGDSNDLAALGVSESGPELRDAILSLNFTGLTGIFHLVNGELHAPGYKVVHAIGQKTRGIGFWTPFGGLMRHLNWSRKGYSTSKDDLGFIIWPGESGIVPKGWENTISEKMMRIGVPAQFGFDPIQKVEHNPLTKETIPSGYVIAVFEAAVKELPYAIDFEYVPVDVEDYDTLVYGIHLQQFDAVVGDVRITANRSEYVDFTLPYIPRGVSMLVPVQDQPGMGGWIFLRPLVLELWLATGAFFVFTGVVVWVLEHRVNMQFRGRPADQIGGILYFSFSTLVFAHKEKLVSNLSRVVVIVWLFVVLILTSSYTAILASLFTLREIQPKITEGFGFAFPKGSSLVNDFSRAILNLTESNQMTEIQRRWFGERTAGPDGDNGVPANILGFNNFWGLFFITGTASTTSLLIFIVSFLYKNRHALSREMTGIPIRQKLRTILEHFDRKEDRTDSPPGNSPHHVSASDINGQATPCTNNGCDSPISVSNHTNFDGTPSREFNG